MKISNLKSDSSPVIVLNYLGMRKRSNIIWTSSEDIIDFFPVRFKNTKKKIAHFSVTMRRLIKGDYVSTKRVDNLDYYSITKFGSELPYLVALANKLDDSTRIDDYDE